LRVLAQLLVERGERLIEQQQLRFLDERASERDALPLAARELVRLALRIGAELDELEHLADALRQLGVRDLVLPEPEGDVLLDGHVREQRIRLEHHVDGPLVRRNRSHVDAVDVDPARGRTLEPGEHAQQRRLAAAGPAEQAEDLLLVDVERDVVDGDEIAELLRYALDPDVRFRVRVLPGLVLELSVAR
jgi:hypothetical protein